MQKNQKDTIIGVIFTFSLVLVISLIAYYLRTSRKEDIKLINNSFGYTKGIVIKKMLYKSHSINVKYIVNGKSYIDSDGINTEDNVSEGDSIIVKYSTEKPELMITQFNDEF